MAELPPIPDAVKAQGVGIMSPSDSELLRGATTGSTAGGGQGTTPGAPTEIIDPDTGLPVSAYPLIQRNGFGQSTGALLDPGTGLPFQQPGVLAKLGPRSNLGWYSPTGTTAAALGAPYANMTYRFWHSLPVAPLLSRLIMLNAEATQPVLTAAEFITSDTFPNPNSVNPTFTNGTFTTVTFGGSGSLTLAASLGSNRVSRSTPSDWCKTQAIPSVDGSGAVYLGWGVFVATNGTVSLTGYNSNGAYMGTAQDGGGVNGYTVWGNKSDARTGGALGTVGVSNQSGNNLGANFGNSNTNFGSPAMEFEYVFDRPVFTLCDLGDSITNGDVASIPCLSPAHFAVCLLSTAANPVILCNQGWSGQTTSQIVQRFIDMLTSGRVPHCAVYSAWSPNDTTGGIITAAEIALMKSNLALFLYYCGLYHVYPVVKTATPFNYSATYDPLRENYCTYLRGEAAYGLLNVDYDTLLTTGGSTPVIQFPNYTNASGNEHPHDGGYIAMGTLLANTLAPIIKQYFYL